MEYLSESVISGKVKTDDLLQVLHEEYEIELNLLAVSMTAAKQKTAIDDVQCADSTKRRSKGEGEYRSQCAMTDCEESSSGMRRRKMDMKQTDKFTYILRRLRESRRMNRKALGELCGLSKNAIGRYERGECEPTLSNLIAIADFFGVSIDYLSGREK